MRGSLTAVIIKCPKRYTAEDNFIFKVSSIGLFFFADKLIVLLSEDMPLVDGRPVQRVRSLTDVFLKVIFRSIRYFEEHLNVIPKVSNELEQEITKALTNKDLLYMFNLGKSLVYYLKAVADCLKRVAGIAMSEVQRATVGASTSTAAAGRSGGVLFVHRCGATLNTHVHLHLCMLDGVVAQGWQGLACSRAEVDEACVQRAAVYQRRQLNLTAAEA